MKKFSTGSIRMEHRKPALKSKNFRTHSRSFGHMTILTCVNCSEKPMARSAWIPKPPPSPIIWTRTIEYHLRLGDMSSLAEIQEAIEKLTSEDRARLREWFDAQDTEETDELLAAIDQGIRSAETERTFSLEEVRGAHRATPNVDVRL